MPSGKAHRKLAVATTPLLVLGGWAVSNFPLIDKAWIDIGIVAIGYLINPAVLSPDMDLVHSDPSDAWGKTEPLWWGYQLLIHKGGGRNPLSHWPPLSSLFRVFYLWAALFVINLCGIGILNLIWYGLFSHALISWAWVEIGLEYWLLIFTFPQFWKFVWGIALGDLLHWLADVAFSYMKK